MSVKDWQQLDYVSNLVTVVIPAYNEQSRIATTLKSIEMLSGKLNLEVIVVCDGCSDNTADVVKSFSGKFRLKVIEYSRNRGKGCALRMGVMVACGEAIAFMDADGSTPPSELLRMLDVLTLDTLDIVIGSRRCKDSIVARQPIHRHLLGRFFSEIVKFSLQLPYNDTQCGFKLFKRRAAKILFRASRYNGFEFDLDILYMAYNKGFKVKEFGVRWNDVAGSKVRVLNDGCDMLKAIASIRLSHLSIPRAMKIQVSSI